MLHHKVFSFYSLLLIFVKNSKNLTTNPKSSVTVSLFCIESVIKDPLRDFSPKISIL